MWKIYFKSLILEGNGVIENMENKMFWISFASDHHRAAEGYPQAAPERARRGQGNASYHISHHISKFVSTIFYFLPAVLLQIYIYQIFWLTDIIQGAGWCRGECERHWGGGHRHPGGKHGDINIRAQPLGHHHRWQSWTPAWPTWLTLQERLQRPRPD